MSVPLRAVIITSGHSTALGPAEDTWAHRTPSLSLRRGNIEFKRVAFGRSYIDL